MAALTNDLVVEILARASESTACYDSGLVCRNWSSLVHIGQAAVYVRDGALLCEEVLLRELASMPNLKSLTLGRQSVTQLSDAFFVKIGRNMRRLECLEVLEGAVLQGGMVTGTGIGHLLQPRLPLDPASPPSPTGKGSSKSPLKSLKLLGCENIPLYDLPASPLLSGLQELELSLSGRDGSGPTDLDSLACCLRGLLQLRKLFLRSHSLRYLPASIGRIRSLRSLTIKMPQLELLPEEIGLLSSLKSLFLFSRALAVLPDTFTRLTHLSRLSLECKILRELPEGVGEMTNLRFLSVAAWRSNTQLPDPMFRLPKLQTLEAAASIAQNHQHLSRLAPSLLHLSCHSLWHTPDLISAMAPLSGLRTLHLSGPCVSKFPEKLGTSLVALEELSLEKLEGVTELPHSFGYMMRLRKLSMSVCPLIAGLPETIGCLTALEELSLSYCRSLSSLPTSLAYLRSLKRVFILFCISLALLPGGALGFQGLEELKVSQWAGSLLWAEEEAGGSSAQQVKPGFSMRKLSVSSSALQCLPDDLGKLSELEELSVHCDRLQALPSSVVNLVNLQALCLSGENIRWLPDDIHLLSSLEKLSIERRGCPRLEALPQSITLLTCLKSLSLFSCSKLREVPDGIGTLPELQELRVGTEHRRIDGSVSMGSTGQAGAWDPAVLLKTTARSMICLPDSLCEARQLKVLEIINLKGIRGLPDALGCLARLQRLIISHCPELRTVPESLGCLGSLRELHVAFLPLLKSLPEDMKGLKVLRAIHIRHCPMLVSLPESMGQVQSLTEVYIEGLDNLLSLPPLHRISGLVELQIIQCPYLYAAPSEIVALPLLSESSRASLEALSMSTRVGTSGMDAEILLGEDGKKCLIM